MRAVKERAVAHSALMALKRGGLDRETYDGLLGVALEFTLPRPWWRFW